MVVSMCSSVRLIPSPLSLCLPWSTAVASVVISLGRRGTVLLEMVSSTIEALHTIGWLSRCSVLICTREASQHVQFDCWSLLPSLLG